MKGVHVPEEEKQRVQYEVVQHTYSIPQRVITRMMEVTDERAKVTGGTKEERVDLWCDARCGYAMPFRGTPHTGIYISIAY